MIVPIPDGFNTQFNVAFHKEFNSENPSTDPAFSRVTTIALNCLHTGVLILTCTNERERIFRVIPPILLAELRKAVEFEALPEKSLISAPIRSVESVHDVVQKILKDIRTNPCNYSAKPYRIQGTAFEYFNKTQHAFIKTAFNQYRKNYKLNDEKVPNTPFSIIDIMIFEPTLQFNSSKVLYCLVKTGEAVPSAVSCFYDSLVEVAERYTDLYTRILLEGSSDEKKRKGSFSLAKDLETECNAPGSFFKEFMMEQSEGKVKFNLEFDTASSLSTKRVKKFNSLLEE